MIKRIGFCCKLLDADGNTVPEANAKATTVAWLNRQPRAVAEQRLWDIMIHNIASVHKLVETVGELDDSLKMVRIGSDILPVYTEPTYGYYWRRPDVVAHAEREFSRIGELARARDVRLSMHPGQFTVLASANPDIVARSIDEFEYHADMARWMGYGKKFQDFKINVHIAGRAGPEGIRAAYSRLSPEARNCLTIENEENAWGLDDCLSLADHIPIVLDIHHHWVREGEYISPSDDRVARVRDSWRDSRPVLHYSVSREDCLGAHSTTEMPDMAALLAEGYKKGKLRAHSDYYWNSAVNEWALSFWDQFDIQCESKAKNLASRQLLEQYTRNLI
jgi:UV DNA damage endonuclease